MSESLCGALTFLPNRLKLGLNLALCRYCEQFSVHMCMLAWIYRWWVHSIILHWSICTSRAEDIRRLDALWAWSVQVVFIDITQPWLHILCFDTHDEWRHVESHLSMPVIFVAMWIFCELFCNLRLSVIFQIVCQRLTTFSSGDCSCKIVSQWGFRKQFVRNLIGVRLSDLWQLDTWFLQLGRVRENSGSLGQGRSWNVKVWGCKS